MTRSQQTALICLTMVMVGSAMLYFLYPWSERWVDKCERHYWYGDNSKCREAAMAETLVNGAVYSGSEKPRPSILEEHGIDPDI